MTQKELSGKVKNEVKVTTKPQKKGKPEKSIPEKQEIKKKQEKTNSDKSVKTISINDSPVIKQTPASVGGKKTPKSKAVPSPEKHSINVQSKKKSLKTLNTENVVKQKPLVKRLKDTPKSSANKSRKSTSPAVTRRVTRSRQSAK